MYPSYEMWRTKTWVILISDVVVSSFLNLSMENWRGQRGNMGEVRMLCGWTDVFLHCLWKIKGSSCGIFKIFLSLYNLHQIRCLLIWCQQEYVGAYHKENKSFVTPGPRKSVLDWSQCSPHAEWLARMSPAVHSACSEPASWKRGLWRWPPV